MGRTLQKAKIINTFDLLSFQKGLIKQEEVREVELEFLVDTGAAMLCLPAKYISQLGLDKMNEKNVRTANGDAKRAVYSPVRIYIMGRDADMNVMEIPEGINAPPLLGYLPLEALDLYVNPKEQKLSGNPETDGKMVLDMF